ncbi:zinc finger protein 70-like, partial [Aricia agestis]|uniref:zinc finger protein 70-like n=1 Tax=Aricia agestis TaxID=91739 RepID=UPI001C2068EC
MISGEEIKENHLMRQGDEIICIKKVCLSDKNKRELEDYNGPLSPLLSTKTHETPVFRDGYPTLDEARFSWSEEDLLMVSQSFESTQLSFGKDSDAAWKTEVKDEYNTSTGHGTLAETSQNSTKDCTTSTNKDPSTPKSKLKVDKSDPRSRLHYVKLVKRNGRTIKFWECGICGRDFLHQYTLMRHLPTHTDERNFRCGECAKSFRQQSTLTQHRAIHSADRPYGCEICSKTFNRLSTLISHRKTHTGEKPYKCNICAKGFHQKGNLRNHMFTHTNERPYRCNICMKGFNQQSNLVCHKIKAHPESSDSNVKSDFTPVVKVRSSSQLLEKSETVNPPTNSEVSSSTFGFSSLDLSSSIDIKSEESQDTNGVIVDPINTYHMGVALAAKQTPFALIKSENTPPVLVKVLDVKFPKGKQMLVPATAEDLMYGGRIVYIEHNKNNIESLDSKQQMSGIQMRVPVVAVVVPKLSEGRLQLCVEEPHHIYDTDDACGLPQPCADKTGCSLLPTAPSPPLDISLELDGC